MPSDARAEAWPDPRLRKPGSSKDQLVPAQARAIEQQLFPDRATFKREENHRWELIDAHWDLPIREVDPHANDE